MRAVDWNGCGWPTGGGGYHGQWHQWFRAVLSLALTLSLFLVRLTSRHVFAHIWVTQGKIAGMTESGPRMHMGTPHMHMGRKAKQMGTPGMHNEVVCIWRLTCTLMAESLYNTNNDNYYCWLFSLQKTLRALSSASIDKQSPLRMLVRHSHRNSGQTHALQKPYIEVRGHQ